MNTPINLLHAPEIIESSSIPVRTKRAVHGLDIHIIFSALYCAHACCISSAAHRVHSSTTG